MPVPSKLNTLLSERDNITKQIQEKQKEIDGTSLDNLKNDILLKEQKRKSIVSNFKEIQNILVSNQNLSNEELLSYEQQLNTNCQNLTDIDNDLDELNQEFINSSGKNNSDSQIELAKLFNQLDANTELTGKAREDERKRKLNEDVLNNSSIGLVIEGLDSGKQKIWIDEALGVFIWYDKVSVISATMKCFFKSAQDIPENAIKDVGYDSLDQLYETISQIKIPGLPTVLSVFIDLVVKAVGNFGKNFFAFKNAIDMLAGFDIGGLIGIAIPGVIKVLEDLQLFFSDSKAWLFKNLMGPLFDINIPIPEFKFDLGAIVPLLPFKIPIPKIDPFGYMTEETPFNLDADQTNIPMDWLKKILTGVEDAEKEEERDLETKRKDKIQSIDNEIDKLLKDLDNNSNVRNEVAKDKKNSEKSIKLSSESLDNLKNEIKNPNLSEEELLTLEIEMEKLWRRINLEKDNLANLDAKENSITDLSPDEKSETQNKIDKLKKDKQNTKTQTNIKNKDFKKKAYLLEVEKGLANVDNIEEQLYSISALGVNVFDDDNLQYIQKIGYNFKNNNHVNSLKLLKSKGVPLGNTTLLKRYYDIGLNINDDSFQYKLDKLKKFNVNILDTKLLNVYMELGFNFNHKTVFDIMSELNKMSINMNNYSLLVKLNMIGFNFNNPNIIDRLITLSKYTDLTENNAYELLISKNVNLNNPYFDKILKRYSRIGLSFSGNNFLQTEQEIFKNVSLSVIDSIFSSINSLFDINYNTLKTIRSILNVYSKYGISIDFNSGKDFSVRYDDYVNKLELLKSFVENGGWVFDGKVVNETITSDELSKIAQTNGLVLTTDINPRDGEVNTDVLEGLYGNFDKIGLNIKDNNFEQKFNSFIDDFAIDIEGSVILATKRNVYMDVKKEKNNLGFYQTSKDTITYDLGKQKPDPKLFDFNTTKIRIENVFDTTVDKQPTQAVAKFDSLNQLGFNYQQPEYGDMLQKLSGLNLDINKFETVDTINSLVSIGYHLSDTQWLYKINLLKDIGFKFKVPTIQKSTTDGDIGGPIDVNMSVRLETLNNLGFNFSKDNFKDMLKFLKGVGINFSNQWFDNAVSELNNFGINFNDDDWKLKVDKFKLFKINFSSNDWVAKMSNLTQLGVDFNGSDWQKKFDKTIQLKGYGLDYNNTDIRKKLAHLLTIGVDFSLPEDQYKEQIEGLVDLGIVTLEDDIREFRNNDTKKYNELILSYEKRIQQKQREIDGIGTYDIIVQINKKEKELQNNNNKIDDLKELSKKSKTESELNSISTKLYDCCLLSTELTKDIEKLNALKISKNKEIEDKGDLLQQEKNDLITEKNSIKRPKPYKSSVYKIGLGEEDKFAKLDEMNINFYDKDWKKNINALVAAGFSFAVDDWRDMVEKFKDFTLPNAVLEWHKKIKKLITSIVSLPVQVLAGFIEKLIDLVKAIINVPLNPSKIPDYAKNLIKKFQGLIELIVKLPSVQGVMDFLFMSPDGLAIVDIFLPGFALMITKLTDTIENNKDIIKDKKAKIKEQKELLSKSKSDKDKKIRNLNNEIDLRNSLLNGNTPSVISKKENDINTKQNNINNNVDILKASITDDMSEATINEIKKQLENYCKEVSNLENEKKENESNLETLKRIPKSELLREVSELENELSKSNSDNSILKAEKELKTLNKEAKDLEETINKIGNFCNWSDNMDEVIGFMRGMSDRIGEEPNKAQEQFESNKEKISKLEKNRDALQKSIDDINNNINPNEKKKQDSLNKEKEQNTNDIKSLENNLCLNGNTLSDLEFDSMMSKLNELKKKDSDLDKSIQTSIKNSNSVSNETSDLLKADKDKIQKEIDDLKSKNKDLSKLANDFGVKKIKQLAEMDDIMKWIPVIINIICSSSPFIVNILVGIFNSVGYMENLPVLFEFGYVDLGC